MEFQKIKTQIIDEIINSFFIENGFIKEGKYFRMKKNNIIIVVEISCQEYYKEVIIENFLINIKVFLDNSNELPPFMCFKSYNIDFPEISCIGTCEEMHINMLKLLFYTKLEELLNEYNSIENIIKIGKEEINKIKDEAIKIKNRLETITNDQSLNNVLNISIKLKEKKIELINDWIQKRTMQTSGHAEVNDTKIP